MERRIIEHDLRSLCQTQLSDTLSPSLTTQQQQTFSQRPSSSPASAGPSTLKISDYMHKKVC